MEFLGQDGWPAPLLKNAELDMELVDQLYLECVHFMRDLYRNCKLVHAGAIDFYL